MPIALTPFDIVDAELTVNIRIEKATPEITVNPAAYTDDPLIVYGTSLGNIVLDGGETVHPTTRDIVKGDFAWDFTDIVPTVNEAAIAQVIPSP